MSDIELSQDALIFGVGFFPTRKSRLSFGGKGASMRTTDRARSALNELIAHGYAEKAKPDDQIPDREYFKGTEKASELFRKAQDSGMNPFKVERWASFEKIPGKEPRPSSISMDF